MSMDVAGDFLGRPIACIDACAQYRWTFVCITLCFVSRSASAGIVRNDSAYIAHILCKSTCLSIHRSCVLTIWPYTANSGVTTFDPWYVVIDSFSKVTDLIYPVG